MPKRYFTIVGYLGDFQLDDAGLWFARTCIEELLAKDATGRFAGPYFGAVVGELEPVRHVALDRLNHPGELAMCGHGRLYLIGTRTLSEFRARVARIGDMIRGKRACVLACAIRGHESGVLERLPRLTHVTPA